MSRQVKAAGGVLWRRQDGVVQVAVVHRPRYDDWSLPKGKLDPGELHVVGAVREVAEETGFAAVAGRTLGESRYRVLDQGRDVPKTVRWWAMRATAGEFVPGAEVDHLQWLTVPEALRRVTAGRDSEPLTAFAAHPPETATVLLLRHGSAGDRDDWAGDDDLRPLDPTGKAQALAAADTLVAWGP
ncbi:MAG: hydrolase, partial [Frankiales bacterium]|nr:hydrolase [Frankiales bacterium]